MNDLRLIETFDGGDVVVSNNDLELTNELNNQVYLALFGGNVEQSTAEVNQEISNERFDFWGNELFHQDEPDFQFNSNFERALQTVALNTEGLQELEQIALADLAFLNEFGTVSVDISIRQVDGIRISVNIDLKPEYQNLITSGDISIDFVISDRTVTTWTDGVGNVFTDGVGNPFTDI